MIEGKEGQNGINVNYSLLKISGFGLPVLMRIVSVEGKMD